MGGRHLEVLEVMTGNQEAGFGADAAVDFRDLQEPVGLRILTQRRRAVSEKSARIEGHTTRMARLTN